MVAGRLSWIWLWITSHLPDGTTRDVLFRQLKMYFLLDLLSTADNFFAIRWMFLLAASAKRQAGNVQRARGALSRPLHSVAQGLLRALIACFSCQAADSGEVSLLGRGAPAAWALLRIDDIRGPSLTFMWVTQKTRACCSRFSPSDWLGQCRRRGILSTRARLLSAVP